MTILRTDGVNNPNQTVLDLDHGAGITLSVGAQGKVTIAVSGGGGVVISVFGRSGAVVAMTGDYSVSQVTGAAPLASPTFTGTPIAPTPSTPDNSTKIATTAYVQNQGYVTSSSAPVVSVFGRTGAVVATSGDYSVGQITGAAPLASPALTGTPTAPTASALTSNTQVATTAYADSAVGVEKTRALAAEALLAPLASPALTGVPTAPTASTPDNSTEIATTAFVKNQGYVTAGTAPVTSVFGRTGAVVAAANDYNFNQIAGLLAQAQLPAVIDCGSF